MRQVAVLFARKDSVYKTLPGCDVYDIDRDARAWPGGAPVVAHPPCRAWASLRHCAKPRAGEKDLALWAIEQVRRWGGVLEHPALSTLWRQAGLPAPGEYDGHGGTTIIVDQHWWGHRARKRTRLYIVGVSARDLPAVPIVLGEATHTVGLWSGRNRVTCRPSIGKREYEATPPAFAGWLVALARQVEIAVRKSRPEAGNGAGATACAVATCVPRSSLFPNSGSPRRVNGMDQRGGPGFLGGQG